ncbi:signal transduction histidine kinase [Swaminathania salitolerans LMG 21291]|uniref:histidine kinase n=1 Tax=Swaminathania salitolerans TaxID=182838 RepID=A0A511BT78_9PROT|nr:signal transduction histidine kinase [Swaminathania salitolerans LMG 21291]GEL01168.1 hypothetical protein SSA02_03310 [Swaminathania salitolerans]
MAIVVTLRDSARTIEEVTDNPFPAAIRDTLECCFPGRTFCVFVTEGSALVPVPVSAGQPIPAALTRLNADITASHVPIEPCPIEPCAIEPCAGWSLLPCHEEAKDRSAGQIAGAIAIDTPPDTLSLRQCRILRAQGTLALGTLAPGTLAQGGVARDSLSVTYPKYAPPLDPERANLGFFLWDQRRGRMTGDPHMATLCGLDRAALREGISWSDFRQLIHRDERPGPDVSAVGWMTGIGPSGLRLVHADGRIVHVNMRVQPHGENCTGNLVDLGHEDRLALRTSQAFLNSMLVSANDCVKILDLEGIITFVNQGALLVLDLCSTAEMVGIFWPDVWQERGRALSLDAIAAARNGETSHFQSYLETRDGRMRLWDVIVTPIFGADGRPERILGVSRDMTIANQEHERLELALQAGTIVGMWLWDPRIRRITGDARMALTLGISPAGLNNGIDLTALLRRIDPEDRNRVRSALSRALRDRTRFHCEFRLLDDDARASHWVEANGACTYDKSGHISHFPGILLDIDAHKRQTLKREALVQLGEGLRALDSESEILSLCAKILGETIEADRAGFADVDCGRELAHVVDAWRRDASMADISGLYAFRAFGDYIDTLKRGEIVAIADVATHPLTSRQAESFAKLGIAALLNLPLMENGALQAVAIVHFDHRHRWDEITLAFVRTVADRSWAAIRQVRAQEALRLMNETLEELAIRRTRERDRLWAISADLLALTDQDGRLRYLNPSWERSFGRKVQEWSGSKFELFVHPADRPRAAEALRLLRENRLDQGVDLRFLHQNGTWHIFNWSGSREGDDIYLIGRDITDRIALEEQLRQSQKMEAVGQLTGGLAHDFNNILAGIGGALGLLSRRIEQGRLSGLDRYISAAQAATDRAAALTHRLLAFSRRQTLDPQPADINTLIVGMEDLIEGTVGPAIVLELALAPEIGLTLVDTNQLENALLNLSINARDAMPDGGHLQIATSAVLLGARQAREWGLRAGRYLVLTVTDTGVGMSSDIMDRAFDPFFTTKPIGKGTGLGLSMIYGFAQQSGGRVGIASTPGEGTTVQIWLPGHEAAIAPPQDMARRPCNDENLNRLQILLVDDEETLRFTVRETLQDWGAVVQDAADGATALAMLNDRERLFDLLITDVGLPGGLNGRQLADAARSLRPGLAVLFITGYAEQAIFDREGIPEKIHILPKPFTPQMLDEKLRGALRAGG